MKVQFFGYIILILLVFQNTLAARDIRELFPSSADLPGWKLNQEIRIFAGDNLFELINGGADIYLEYGFNQVASVQYTDPAQNNIQVEIYEMIDDAAAYGIFGITQQMVGWTSDYGHISSSTDDYIAFWKGQYYVNLSWSSKQRIEEPLISTIAGFITGKITDEGKLPSLVSYFERDSLDPRTIYLKGNIALSNFFYFDYKDIFTLAEALAWTSGNYHTIIIKYDDADQAITKIAGAKTAMANNKRFSDMTNTYQGFSCNDNKGNHILARQTANFIVLMVGLEAGLALVPLMDGISQKIEGKAGKID